MDFQRSLYEAEHICLAPIDHEKDPEVISRWTHDSAYLRLMELEPARPLSPAQVKKKLEAIEKEMEERKNVFHFTVRMRSDDRLIGVAQFAHIEWTHGNGWIQLGIGASEDRRCGYGTQVLGLLLRFAFDELNLYRLTARVPQYNAGALRLLQKANFSVEVNRRQALQRYGRYWDLLQLGLLREEWKPQ
jgi:RimJ/RimL family protein N-acetyltransferase